MCKFKATHILYHAEPRQHKRTINRLSTLWGSCIFLDHKADIIVVVGKQPRPGKILNITEEFKSNILLNLKEYFYILYFLNKSFTLYTLQKFCTTTLLQLIFLRQSELQNAETFWSLTHLSNSTPCNNNMLMERVYGL